MTYIDRTVTMEDVTILPGSWRNFSGKASQFNSEGDRNFAVLLPNDVAKAMSADGWNVKTTKPQDGEDEGNPYLGISVSYKGRPPEVWVITKSRGRVKLGENEVATLDWLNYDVADVIVSPYEWVVNGKTGIKAYLQKMFVVVKEDALDLKYADVPERDQSPAHAAQDGPSFQ
jgi:hypothetical protein